ncbi:unnamed protein product [Dibothriocephalus latus]|uniref:NADH dehydrogenase [ubiquinone] 1 beta subcomplex subunit 9 n=1 Tax=Dibothriocephalus latus TaxID=60516 RepID=A0A3P7NK81_DIBLA|nr:unnamed protein product [Dibothriocephalus latus]
MRARFEENRHITDPIKAKKLLEEGWAELKKKKFAFPYLCRLVDNWHPLEKLQFPDYFARREKRKAEFVERWKLRYGEPEPQTH